MQHSAPCGPCDNPRMATTHPLISVIELADRIDDPDVRVADIRWYLGKPGAGRAAYDQGHIPGAVHLDLDTELAAEEGPGRHPLPDPAAFAATLAARGIGSEHFVVAYDDMGAAVAGRLWWMLDTLGHERVAVLDGGIGAWQAAGLPLSTHPTAWPRAELTLAPSWTRTIDRDALRDRLGDVVLLDARAANRYSGEFEPVDPAAGHIPTARNLPTSAAIGDDGHFRGPAELASLFRGIGVDGTAAEVVTSCGSGTSACQHALAMRVAGLPDPILYPGSFSDWGRSGYPVAVGPDPGTPPGPDPG
jgi:thiosulfate/3-mercaptopyruvate sulfurtransferase